MKRRSFLIGAAALMVSGCIPLPRRKESDLVSTLVKSTSRSSILDFPPVHPMCRCWRIGTSERKWPIDARTPGNLIAQ